MNESVAGSGASAEQSPLAWLCDLDGTLYSPGQLKLFMAAELALFGMGKINVIKKFRQAHEALREELRMDPSKSFAPSPFDEQVRRAADALNQSPADVREIITEWMVQRPGKWLKRNVRQDLIKEIVAFRAQGGRTAVVSDYPASPKLAAMGIAKHFELVVCSGETEGLTRLKPAPDAFLLAAKRLGVEPARCLVLGDRDDADGDAARAAGMQFRLIR